MDPQVQQQLMIWGGAFPAGLAIVTLLIFWSIHTRKAMWSDGDEHDEQASAKPTKPGPVWLMPLLIATGFIGAVSAQFPSFEIWPSDNTYRLPHAMVLIALVGLLEALLKPGALVMFIARTLAYGGVFCILASGYRGNDIVFASDWVYFGWMGIAAITPALLAMIHEQNSKDIPGWIDAGCWMLVLGGMMPTLFFNGSATGSTILPGVLAVLGPAAVVGLICKPLKLSRGGITTLVGVVLIVTIGSSVHSELRSLQAVLLLIAAVATGLIRNEGSSTFRYILVRAGIAAVLLAGAAALAHHEYQQLNSDSESSGYDSYLDYDSDSDG
ncbi:unnamed protein product [Symbiodinium sp. CCMP2592]|nr:unnamed protein product [Symbiodinium sp. CCMP2592]